MRKALTHLPRLHAFTELQPGAGTGEGQGSLLLLLIRVGHLDQNTINSQAEPEAGCAARSIDAAGLKPAIFSAVAITLPLRVPLLIAIFTT